MNLYRTALLNSIAVAARLGSALVLNKLLAVYVGPAGYAVIGQFQNAVSLVLNLSGGVFANGVVQQTAHHAADECDQHRVWKTAFALAGLASLAAGLVLMLAGPTLSAWLLQRQEASQAFVWAGLAMPAMAANILLLSVANGKKEVGVYVASSVLGSIAAVAVTGTLAALYGLQGALLAFVITPAISLACTAWLLSRRGWFKSRFFFGMPQRQVMRQLGGFGLMGLTTALAGPATYIAVRSILSARFGVEGAGHWQAMWKISELYTSLVTTTLSLYYLPRLAELTQARELRTEISRLYWLVLPLLILCASTIFLLRDFIIQNLFTAEFQPMRQLFAWQMVGDVLKLGAWVLAFVMLGRAMTATFVVTEIVFNASFVLLTLWLTQLEGLRGVTMAYACNCALYWIAMMFLIGTELQNMGRAAPRPAPARLLREGEGK
ncbi:MAG: Lipid flippase [Paucimonas sp.]|nr:Lipid flippase [Paucimonas sp.]